MSDYLDAAALALFVTSLTATVFLKTHVDRTGSSIACRVGWWSQGVFGGEPVLVGKIFGRIAVVAVVVGIFIPRVLLDFDHHGVIGAFWYAVGVVVWTWIIVMGWRWTTALTRALGPVEVPELSWSMVNRARSAWRANGFYTFGSIIILGVCLLQRDWWAVVTMVFASLWAIGLHVMAHGRRRSLFRGDVSGRVKLSHREAPQA